MSKIKVDDEVLALAGFMLESTSDNAPDEWGVIEVTPEDKLDLAQAIQIRINEWFEEDAQRKYEREMASKSCWRDEDDERDLRIMRWEN